MSTRNIFVNNSFYRQENTMNFSKVTSVGWLIDFNGIQPTYFILVEVDH